MDQPDHPVQEVQYSKNDGHIDPVSFVQTKEMGGMNMWLS